MKNQNEITKWEAKGKLVLFLKLRKNKTITDKTILDFEKLINGKLSDNFKFATWEAIHPKTTEKFDARLTAIKSLLCGVIKWQSGGNCRIKDIDSFGYYGNNKYKANIKGELLEIAESDYLALNYITFGEL